MARKKDKREKELDALVDDLLKDHRPEDILNQDGLVQELTKRLVERALEGEMTEHLGYEKHASEGRNGGNSRNGKTSKRIKTGNAELEIEVPRDREGDFEPTLVPKGRRRLPGFDDKVIALYARGMTTREIQSGLMEIYGVEVSPSLISAVTDSVLEDVKAWQSRPLDAVYPIVYLDAIHVKMRASGHVQNTAVYVALGINLEGCKELLGLWVGEAEGAKFLAVGAHATQEPRRPGYPGRFGRWPEGIPRGDRERVPQDPGPIVHRPHGAQFPAVRLVEGAPGRSQGSASHLHGVHPGGGRAGAGRVRSQVG